MYGCTYRKMFTASQFTELDTTISVDAAGKNGRDETRAAVSPSLSTRFDPIIEEEDEDTPL